MADTVKALLSVCLAFIGCLITITIFFIYKLVFRVKRQFVYHISVSERTTHTNSTGGQRVTESSAATGHPEATGNQRNEDDGKDTDSLTRNLSFSNFERPEPPTIDTEYELESTENQMISEHPDTIEQPQITLNEGRTDDRDSLTQNILHRHDEKPQQPVDTAHQERIEASIENTVMTMHSETTEYYSENVSTIDDDKDSDILTRGRLSFSTFEKLIEYAGTSKVSETTDYPENTGYPGIQGNAEQPTTEDHSGNLETITENFAGIPNADDYAKPTDYTMDDSKNAYRLTRGILINNQRREVNTSGNTEIIENEDTSNNNDSISAISSSNTEKQVSFSGNDSTYIVQRKERTVQLIQYDETSNFEFVKFARQQQKKT